MNVTLLNLRDITDHNRDLIDVATANPEFDPAKKKYYHDMSSECLMKLHQFGWGIKALHRLQRIYGTAYTYGRLAAMTEGLSREQFIEKYPRLRRSI